MAPFDVNSQQNGIVLREIVYVMITVREILRRVFEKDQAEAKLKELAEFMISKLSSDLYEENALKKNLQKLVVKFLFVFAVLLPTEQLEKAKTALVQSLYSTLQGQIIFAETFRNNNGQVVRNKTMEKVNEMFAQA